MARSDARGGPQTRSRIAEVASGLFAARGFDAVTVAEVARAAGVSSVTVFNHFPRKEDLYLDRSQEAEELLRHAVRDREADVPAVDALTTMAFGLAGGHPLSGLDSRATPFFRTVAGSPALIARAREIAAELQGALADELDRDPAATDPSLLAAFFVSGYTDVLIGTARRMLAGVAGETLAADHAARLGAFADAIRRAFPASG